MKLIIGFLLSITSIFLLYYFLQRSIIYKPNTSKPSLETLRESQMHEIILETSDGLSITSWYKPAQAGQPTLLYLHGNAGNISGRAKIVQPFLDKGYGVFLLGYRGYGGNPGTPSEQGFYRDANAAWQFLMNEKIPSKCIVIYGESLGTGVAIELAKEHQSGAIILLAPYTSLDDLAQHHYPFLPVKLLLKDHYDSISKLSAIKLPMLVLVAEKDMVIPNHLSNQFYHAAKTNKKWMMYPNINHQQLPDSVQSMVIDFLENNLNCKSEQS